MSPVNDTVIGFGGGGGVGDGVGDGLALLEDPAVGVRGSSRLRRVASPAT